MLTTVIVIAGLVTLCGALASRAVTLWRASAADPIDALIAKNRARPCRDGSDDMSAPDWARINAIGERRWQDAQRAQRRLRPVSNVEPFRRQGRG